MTFINWEALSFSGWTLTDTILMILTIVVIVLDVYYYRFTKNGRGVLK